MDEFKKYLQQNREQIDVDEPSAELLKRIQRQTAVNSKARMYKIPVRIIAAACLAAIIFLGMQFLLKKDKPAKTETVIVTPAVKTKEPVIKIIDTLLQPAITRKQETIAQQKKQEPQKQMPVAYQLLNSFEQNYNKLISLQLKSIRNTAVYGESPDYFNGFKISMRQIETDEAAIKSQIKKIGLNDALLEQLINVYQQKINLLKNLQHEIGSMNNKIKENQQPADSIKSFYINI